MPKHIQKNTKLLVVSDTGMLIDNKGDLYAFGPVVKELNNLLLEFDEITWIGFNRENQINNKSFVRVGNDRIKPILLKEVGGKTLLNKIKIIFSYPEMFIIILNCILKHKYIHSRAPSNPAVIVMFLSLFFYKKTFWHKYAGSWIDDAPFFYKFQRFLLSKLNLNSIVSINGNFSMKNNILPFENPCLDFSDREFGYKILKEKCIERKINFCFVGALTSNKGVDYIIKSLQEINSEKIGEIHFVGDSIEKEYYIKKAKNIKYKIVFHGFLAKDKIRFIYEKSHFIILPSKSEGFPKVIGEAMNFGCIPIVSDISCIGEYIKNKKNGFLIEKPIARNLTKLILNSLELKNEDFLKWINYNYNLSIKFTYSYYNNRVIKEIFKLKQN